MKTIKYTVEIDIPDDELISTSHIRDLLCEDKTLKWIRVSDPDGVDIAAVNEPLLPPPAIPDGWEQFRREAAKDILCALIDGGIAQGANSLLKVQDGLVEGAIGIADRLIEKLKEDKQ